MLNISIITKDQVLYEGEAKSAIVPTKLGIIEVLSDHMPLVSALSSGEIILKTSKEEELKFEVQSGVLEVQPKSNVIVLVN